MGELARRRSARDLWISRGHLYAVAAGALCACALSFAVGYRLGGGDELSVPGGVESASAATTDDALVELLARVEANAEPDGGVRKLTFPDALAGTAQELPVPEPAAEAPVASVVQPAANPVAPSADEAPVGAYTLEVARLTSLDEAVALRDRLRAEDVPAWIGLEREGGVAVHRVAVGGFVDEDAAVAAVEPLRAALGGAEATVVPIRR